MFSTGINDCNNNLFLAEHEMIILLNIFASNFSEKSSPFINIIVIFYNKKLLIAYKTLILSKLIDSIMKNIIFIIVFCGFANAQAVDPDFFNQTWYLYEIVDTDTGDIFIVDGWQPYGGEPEIEQITPTIFIDKTLQFNGVGVCNTISGTLEQDASGRNFRTSSTTGTNNACGFFEDNIEPYLFGPFAFVDPVPTFFTIIDPIVTTNSDGFQTMNYLTQPFVYYTFRNTPILSVDDTKKSAFSIFPNPVEDMLQIKSEGLGITTIRIFSVTGAVLLESHITIGANSIEVSALPTGIYFLKVNSQDREHTFKIIKK